MNENKIDKPTLILIPLFLL